MTRRNAALALNHRANRRWAVIGLVSGLILASGCAKPQYQRANIQSENPGDRILAIRAAGEAGDRKAVPLLVDRLDDEDDGVRFFAILALERLTGTRMGYEYAEPVDERAAAVDRWRAFVRKGSHLSANPKAVADEAPPRGGTMEGGAAPR